MLFNDRLDSILKKAYDSFLGLPSYEEYNSEIRSKKQEQDREQIFKSTRKKLEELSTNIRKEIDSINAEINGKMFPALSKEVNSIYQEKTFGSAEFQNALMIVKEKPKHIAKILQQAIDLQRYDFAFSVIDLFLSDTTIEQSYRMTVENIRDGLNSQLGFVELRKRKEDLELENAEVNRYLDIVNLNPFNLEAEIKMRSRVSRAMDEAGQLEKENVFVR